MKIKVFSQSKAKKSAIVNGHHHKGGTNTAF